MQRLVEFANRISNQLPTIGYKLKKYQWIVTVQQDYTFHFLKADRNDQRTIPDISRSSGVRPILLTDKAEYVFGLNKEGANERQKKRTKECHNAYMNLLKECADETDSYGVQTVIKALEMNEYVLPEDIKESDIIIFRVPDDHFPHEEFSVREFWYKKTIPETSGEQKKMCIVCGKMAPAVERHSMEFTIGKDRTKLISANSDAYLSYGLKASEVAPTCFICEQKYGQALTYLLNRYSDPNQRGGPHTFATGGVTYVYWMKEINEEMSLVMSWLTEPDSESVKRILLSPFTGVQSDTSDFYLLALTANKARLVVRDYTEKPFWKVKEQLKTFFVAQDVGNNRFYSVYSLASAMYRDASKELQKFAVEEWVNWALNGQKLSGRIATHILNRIQASGEMNVLHASAIKSWLISQNKGVWTVHLDEGNNSAAYLCGRLFAVLEKIQETAIGSNETIAARFFGSASTIPKSVFGLLIRNSQAHLSKIQKEKPGLAIDYSKKVQAITEHLNDFPAVLNLHKQAEFSLGYYHEKQNFYKPKAKNDKGEN